MKSTHRYEIWPETLKPDALWEGVRTFAAERGMPAKDSGYFNLETSASEEILTDSIEEFLKIIKITPTYQVLVSSQEFGKRPGKHLSIYIDIRGGGISISAESPDVDLVAATHAHLTSNFGLRKRHLPLPTPSRATYPAAEDFSRSALRCALRENGGTFASPSLSAWLRRFRRRGLQFALNTRKS